MRIVEVPDAIEVLIELGERYQDLENLKRASYYVVGGKRAFLESIARRAKYGFFIWKVVSKNHVGWLPKDLVYEGRDIGWCTSYRVIMTKPEGEVQVTPTTKVVCRLIEF
jgi:hypothetical protein